MAKIIQPGADYKDFPVAWAGADIVPRFSGKPLISLHLFGTDWPLPIGFDYSNNRRHLIRNGVPPVGGDVNEHPYSVELGSQRNYRYPLTFAEIGALGGGEATVCAILKTPPAGSGFAPFSGLDTDITNADYLHIGYDATSTANSPLIRRRYSSTVNNDRNMTDTVTRTVGTTSGSPNITYTGGLIYAGQPISGAGIQAGTTLLSVNPDAGTAVLSANATATASITATITLHRSKWEFVAASIAQARVDGYRQWPGQSQIQAGQANAGGTAVPFAGSRYPRVGYIYGAAANAYKGSAQIAMLPIYGGALTSTEVEAVYTSGANYIAGFDENFWTS